MAQYDYDFDKSTMTVQGSHRDMRQEDVFPGQGYVSAYPGYSRSYSLETRLASRDSTPLQWVAGLYGYKEDDNGSLFVLLAPTYTAPFYSYNPNLSDDTSYAAFGQTTWSIIDGLRLTTGLRWTHDHKIGDIGSEVPGQTIDVKGVGNWSDTNYRVGLDYDLTPRSMVYGSVATGYKAGGFSFGFTPEYQPEHLTAYEIGSKNRFLDNSLQVNWSAYYYRYINFETQYTLTTVNPENGQTITTGTVTNAGSANIYGSSIDLQWAVSADDRISTTLTYLHAFFGADDLTHLGLQDYSGQPIQDTPRWAALVGYDHYWTVWGGGRLDAQARVKYTDERHIFQNAVIVGTPPGTPINPDVVAPAYAYLNFLLRYDSPDSKWNVTGYVNNVTDKITFNNAAYSYNGGAYQITAQPAEPRTFGVIVGVKF